MKKITVIQINSAERKLIPVEIEYENPHEINGKLKALLNPKCTSLGMASQVGNESIYCDDDGWENLAPNKQGAPGFKLDKVILVPGNAVCVGAETNEYPFGGTFTFPLDKLRKFIKFGDYAFVDNYFLGR